MSKSDLSKFTTLREYDKLLLSAGYTKRTTGGSHMVYSAIGKPSLSIPCHNRMTEKLAPGTKRNIDKLILGESYYSK
jgi:predicted RNA binding protein YcfA (HicA-like mRNA interferase family)